MKYKKNSDARIKANNKHDRKTYSRLTFRMRHLEMKCFKNFCDNKKYSYNNFIVTAIKEKIERNTGKSFDEFLKESEEIKSSSSGDTVSSLETENKKES